MFFSAHRKLQMTLCRCVAASLRGGGNGGKYAGYE